MNIFNHRMSFPLQKKEKYCNKWCLKWEIQKDTNVTCTYKKYNVKNLKTNSERAILIDTAEEKTGELENTETAINQKKNQEDSRRINEVKTSEPWDSIRQPNMRVTESQKKRREKRSEQLFEGKMARIFSNLLKIINLQIKRVQH